MAARSPARRRRGVGRWNLGAPWGVGVDERQEAAMCYETYERLLWTRAVRRAAERPAKPDPEEPKPETGRAPVQPVTLEEAQTREEEPA